MIAKALIFINL